MITSIVGTVAALCTTFAMAPQVIKSLQTKETKDVSLLYMCVLTFGIIMWIIYGALIKDSIVFFANLVTFGFAFTMVILKLKWG
jgi:MtN3 and saliva related transmembrane protein